MNLGVKPTHNSSFFILHSSFLIENLVAGYPNRVLLRNLSFCLHEPTFVAILGHNGSGKTTFFRVLTGQLPYEGQVQILGQELRTRRRGCLATCPSAGRSTSSSRCGSWC